MADRTKAPQLQQVGDIQLPDLKKIVLKNGFRVFVLNRGTQEVLKLELVFMAGRPYEKVRLASRATAELIKEGTQKLTAEQIAEKVDFYGGTLSMPVDLDTSNIVLFCLKKYLDVLLPLLVELIVEPSFPEEEIIRFKAINKQRLSVNLSKNDVVAYRQVTESIFGSDHPYGYNSHFEEYDRLNRDDLVEHLQRTYCGSNGFLLVSGLVDEGVIKLIEKHFAQGIPIGEKQLPHIPEVTTEPKDIVIEKKNTIQSAIRIGRRTFSRDHTDYNDMYILNTILGGYFGSRLMSNIREHKGYTYNIFSALDCMRYDGYFYIGTEVSHDKVIPTVKEIQMELDRLVNEPIGESEMAMVKSYLIGYLLTSLDGPFNIADLCRKYLAYDLEMTSFSDLVARIQRIESKALRDLAGKYFDPLLLTTVHVGQ